MSILVFIFAICSISLVHGMDNGLVVDDQSLAWEAVLSHGVKWFDYIMISKLAAVSKDHDTYLRNTAHCRKEYLIKRLNLPEDVEWHRYGAMGGNIWHNACLTCSPEEDLKNVEHGLHRRRFYLNENGIAYQPYKVYSNGFRRCLPTKRRPFFNDKSDFCFYGYGDYVSCSDEQSGKVIGYYWFSSKNLLNLDTCLSQCMTNIENEKSALTGLEIFLEFPKLLNAFLKSCKVYQERSELRQRNIIKIITEEVYAIEGVKIPKNYEYHKQYFSTIKYKSFNDLPKNVREVIVTRYEMQNLDNNSKIYRINECVERKR